jgi:hypothetical protein
MLSVANKSIVLCHYAECHYAECRYAECRYSDCHYAECRYAECRYAECRGAVTKSLAYFICERHCHRNESSRELSPR